MNLLKKCTFTAVHESDDPMGTLRPWLAEAQFRLIMHASGLLDGVIVRLFSSKSLLQP